jgi:conserved hypothetical protein, YceG family
VALRQRQGPISSKNSFSAQRAHARASQEFRTYDTSAIKPKRSKAPFIIAALIAVIAVAAIVFVVISCQAHPEGSLPADQEAVVVVEQGESASQVAATLVDEGLIGTADVFVNLVKEKNAASAIIPGSYLFKGKTPVEDILSALMAGPASTADTLTVPEGYIRTAIAEEVQRVTNGRISMGDFMNATENAATYAAEFPFLEEAGTNNLEGFLFPKTYAITATDTAQSVVKMMLAQYQAETAGLDWAYPEEAGLNHYQALILASIVEKESNPDNMATVASVFYNRLASDRPYLESDATTAYEVGHDPSGEEVHANTPYSTYTNAGLPPTPICNPSLKALQAVCTPEQTDYMYFYSGGGEYTFSVTYEDHQSTYS